MTLDSKSGRAPTPSRSTTPDQPSIAPARDSDPMARPTPADLLVLADIANVLGEVGEDRELLDLAARWRWQARAAMRPAALRAELEASPAEASALIADLSAQTGSLEKAYRLLGPDPAPVPPADGSEAGSLFDPGMSRDDLRRWTR
jgi:hypothetical protein